MNTWRIAAVSAVLTALLGPVLTAQKLSGVVGYNVRQIAPRLAKAEKLFEQGDRESARSCFDTAKSQWDTLQVDYKSKIDNKHPDIVELRQAFARMAAKFGAPVAKKSRPEDPPKGAAAGAPKAPPAAMLYVMKQIQHRLDGAGGHAKAGELDRAKAAFKTADDSWTSTLR